MKILGVTIDVEKVSFIGTIVRVFPKRKDSDPLGFFIPIILGPYEQRGVQPLHIFGTEGEVKGAKKVLDRAVKKALARKQSQQGQIRLNCKAIWETFEKELFGDKDHVGRLWMEAQKPKSNKTKPISQVLEDLNISSSDLLPGLNRVMDIDPFHIDVQKFKSKHPWTVEPACADVGFCPVCRRHPSLIGKKLLVKNTPSIPLYMLRCNNRCLNTEWTVSKEAVKIDWERMCEKKMEELEKAKEPPVVTFEDRPTGKRCPICAQILKFERRVTEYPTVGADGKPDVNVVWGFQHRCLRLMCQKTGAITKWYHGSSDKSGGGQAEEEMDEFERKYNADVEYAQIQMLNRKSSLCKKCGMGRGKIDRFVDLFIMQCVKSGCPVGTESYSTPEEALKAWNEMNKPEEKHPWSEITNVMNLPRDCPFCKKQERDKNNPPVIRARFRITVSGKKAQFSCEYQARCPVCKNSTNWYIRGADPYRKWMKMVENCGLDASLTLGQYTR